MKFHHASLRVTAAILLGACAALSADVAAASTFEWTSPASDLYTNAARWTRTAGATLAPPVAGDTVNLNEAGAYTISFNANAASDTLNVTAGTVWFAGTGVIRTYSVATGLAEANVSGSTLNLGTSLSNPLNLTVANLLDVESDGALNVRYGSVVDTVSLFVGCYGGTTNAILVDGGGLGATGGGYLGFNGYKGSLTYQNSSAGIWGASMNLADSTGGGTGNLTVQSASQITVSSIYAATVADSGGASAITLTGASSRITQSDSATLTLGSTSGTTAALNISDNATFTTGTGATTVNKTGTINVATGGTFAPKGDVAVSGGAIDVDAGGVFLWDANRVLSVNSGGRVTVNSTFDAPIGSAVNIYGAGSKLQILAGAMRICDGAQVNVSNGGSIATPSYLDIGTDAGNGTLLVDGAGSTVTAGTTSSWWGQFGNTASVTFRNGATGAFGQEILLGADSDPATTATLSVQSGAQVSVRDLFLVPYGGASGSIVVTGADSRITHEAGTNLNVGSSSGNASLSVGSGAVYTVQNDAYTYLNETGTISVDGGSAYLGNLVNNGGALYFSSGLLDFTGSLLIGPGGLLGEGDYMGSGLVLASNRHLNVHGDTTLGAFSSLTLDGGTFWTDTFNPSAGTFRFLGGTLGVGMSGVGEFDLIAIGPNVTVNPDCYFIVSNKAVLSGLQRLAVNGGRFQAQALSNYGAISVEGGGELNFPGIATNQGSGSILVGRNSSMYLAGGISNLGEIVLDGGSAAITGPGGIANTGLVRGDGRIDGVLYNYGPGEIRAEAGKRLRFDAVSPVNEALLSLQGGTLEFAQPLLNDTTGAVMGRGTLKVGGTGLANNGSVGLSGGFTDIYGKLTNNRSGKVIISGGSATTFYDDVTLTDGSTFRVSDGSSATFFGNLAGAVNITGAGTVYEEGDLRPGFSPAAISFGGNLVLSSSSSTYIELGGTTPGTQYDTVAVTLKLTMGGLLDISLIDSFVPAHNDAFTILTYGSKAGAFDTINGLNIGPRLNLVPTITATSMTLNAVQGGPGQWRYDISGNASVGTNWTAALPNGVGDVATFGSVITATRNVSVDAPTTLGGMVFDNANNYGVTGPAALTLQNTGITHAAVTVNNSGSGDGHNVSANVTLASPTDVAVADGAAITFSGALNNAAAKTITKAGLGAVTFSGPQTHGVGAVLNVNAGTANLNSDTGSSTVSNLSVNTSGDAALNFGSTQHLAALSLGGTSTVTLAEDSVTITKTLTFVDAATPAATLDLAKAYAVVDYTGDSPAADIHDWVEAGAGPGLDWTGQGITSNIATYDPGMFAVGYAQNDCLIAPYNDTDNLFYGQAVDDTAVVMGLALVGDLDLNGKVDGNDVTVFLLNYNMGAGFNWWDGDIVDQNGAVDGNDVTYFLLNYGSNLEDALASYGLGEATGLGAVPEPATLALLTLGVAAILRRRR